MKILIYGAGVLGCNLARNLFRAGKDVTLLARGNWAEEIRKNGLRIKDKFSLRTSVSCIPVVTTLAPDAQYDVIFVVLRYTQLGSALDTLQTNRTKNIVFVGNNVRARALAAALPEKNVLFAFALSASDSCPMVIFFRSMETTRSASRCPAESAKANRTFFPGSAAASALACTLFPTKTMFFVRFARSVSRTESSCV